jgi:hypothetical protein
MVVDAPPTKKAHLQINVTSKAQVTTQQLYLIINLSFYGMNPYTAKHAPPKSKQFGHALDWILYQL